MLMLFPGAVYSVPIPKLKNQELVKTTPGSLWQKRNSNLRQWEERIQGRGAVPLPLGSGNGKSTLTQEELSVRAMMAGATATTAILNRYGE